MVAGVAWRALLALETHDPFALLFETISALGTVGTSPGVTGSLSPLSKLVIIVLMFMGRVGILTFGILMSARDETPEEESDNELVLS